MLATQTLQIATGRGHGVSPGFLAQLNAEQRRFLNRLEGFEAPYLEEKLLKDGVFDSTEKYQAAFTEFKKFVALRALFGEGQGMASKEVDQVWHQFILFTRQYHAFCREFLGEYFHHNPKTSYTPLSDGAKSKLISRYEAVFGEMPDLWNKGSAECGDCCEGCNCD